MKCVIAPLRAFVYAWRAGAEMERKMAEVDKAMKDSKQKGKEGKK